MSFRGHLYAIQAGSCAAMASVCAKLAVSSDTTFTLIKSLFSSLDTEGSGHVITIHEELVTLTRLGSVAGIILFNALMWVLFTKSMHLCSSTLEATIFNTASNFFFTAVVGKLLFGEQLKAQWWVGSALLIVGLTVLHSNQPIKGHNDRHTDHPHNQLPQPQKDKSS